MMFPKDPRYENEKLTRTAKGTPCQLQVPNVCNRDDATSVWAHSNLSRHGRGKDHKSHDCFGVIACGACHYWLDFSAFATRAEKEEAFERGRDRTLLYLFRSGKLKVVA